MEIKLNLSKNDDYISNLVFIKAILIKNTVEIFEDEGFSGGNTDRTQFQQMLKAERKKYIRYSYSL